MASLSSQLESQDDKAAAQLVQLERTNAGLAAQVESSVSAVAAVEERLANLMDEKTEIAAAKVTAELAVADLEETNASLQAKVS